MFRGFGDVVVLLEFEVWQMVVSSLWRLLCSRLYHQLAQDYHLRSFRPKIASWTLNSSVIFCLMTTTWRRFRRLFPYCFILPVFVFWCSTGHWTLLSLIILSVLDANGIRFLAVPFCWRVFMTEPWHLGNLGSILFELIQFVSSYCSAILYVLFAIFSLSFVILCSWMDPKLIPTLRGLHREVSRFGHHVRLQSTRISLDTHGP